MDRKNFSTLLPTGERASDGGQAIESNHPGELNIVGSKPTRVEGRCLREAPNKR